MDRELNITTPDGKIIYGIVRGELTQPLIIFLHGLTSDIQEPKYYLGSRFFEEQGIATYRFAQYAWHDDARTLDECSLQQLGEDLDTVITHFRSIGVKDITVVGHSLGALVILSSYKKDYERMIFWDGSYDVWRWWKDYPYIKQVDTYILSGGARSLLSPDMFQEIATIDFVEKLRGVKKPSLFVYAKEGALVSGGEAYYAAAQTDEKELHFIEETSHNFDEEGKTEELLDVTNKWLQKQLALELPLLS